MKNIIKGQQPALLANYVQANPTNTWTQCSKNPTRREAIQTEIRLNQGGLCAYCEIDLKPADTQGGLADFRVEHFHPKSDTSTAHNWHLDWQNLLGCCHGGSQKDVTDAANRFTSPDTSCDVPKADNNWDNDILNPLRLPAFPPLFNYHRSSGDMTVNSANCQQATINRQQAQNTIDYLNLNAKRLTRLRSAELNEINKLFAQLVANGLSDSEARERLAKAILVKKNHHWPVFFSAVRSYLGQAAEQQLNTIAYQG